MGWNKCRTPTTKPTLAELCHRGEFEHNGHTWLLKSDALGWLLYKDGKLDWEYASRVGVADDVIKRIGL